MDDGFTSDTSQVAAPYPLEVYFKHPPRKIFKTPFPSYLHQRQSFFVCLERNFILIYPPPPVGDCGKTGRKNGAMEFLNIGARKGTDDAIKLEKEDNSRAVRSYAGITREDVQTQLGKNRLIIP